MAKKQAVFIVGAIAVGAAVARSLFLLYPDLAFRNTGFDSQSSAATDVPVIVDANDPTLAASVGANSTSSTAGTNSTMP